MKRIIFLFSILFILSCADEGLVNIKNNTDNGSYNPNNPQDIIPLIPLEPSKPIIPDKPQDIIPAIPLEPSSSIYDYDVNVSVATIINKDTDISKWGFLPCESIEASDSVLADRLGRPTSTSTKTVYVSATIDSYSKMISILIDDDNSQDYYGYYCSRSNVAKLLKISMTANKSFDIHDRELIWETMAEYIKKDPYTSKDNKKETITIKSSVGK